MVRKMVVLMASMKFHLSSPPPEAAIILHSRCGSQLWHLHHDEACWQGLWRWSEAVAMARPNNQLIAELIILSFSEGLAPHAKSVGRKLVAIFNLSK